MLVEQGINNYAVYEDVNTFYGMSEVTLPEIAMLTEELKGAGISGALNMPFSGHVEAMSMTMNFRAPTREAIALSEQRNHTLDLRASQQYRDNQNGIVKQQAVKHVVVGSPTKFVPGKLGVATTADTSVEMSVTYYALFVEGRLVTEVDPINFKYVVNGIDYLADVRKALGM
jgi:P2 family phage contractile tail tube protein